MGATCLSAGRGFRPSLTLIASKLATSGLHSLAQVRSASNSKIHPWIFEFVREFSAKVSIDSIYVPTHAMNVRHRSSASIADSIRDIVDTEGIPPFNSMYLLSLSIFFLQNVQIRRKEFFPASIPITISVKISA